MEPYNQDLIVDVSDVVILISSLENWIDVMFWVFTNQN